MANHIAKPVVGQKFGSWTVIGISKDPVQGRNYYWLCRCICGVERAVAKSILVSGQSTSCGCSRHKGDFRRINITGALRNYQQHARQRNLVWNISREDAIKLMESNCHYCGSPPSNISQKYPPRPPFIYNGLDRVDNTKGYTLDNVVPCCKDCNLAKREKTYDEFIAWIKRAADYLESQES